MWHDHGKIAGQSYMLIFVSCIYDPAVYYTPEELVSRSVSLDVTCIVELPEIHFKKHIVDHLMLSNLC